MNIRVLSEAYQTIELLAFLREIALWRTGLYHSPRISPGSLPTPFSFHLPVQPALHLLSPNLWVEKDVRVSNKTLRNCHRKKSPKKKTTHTQTAHKNQSHRRHTPHKSWTYTCASSFVCTSPFAVTTIIRFLDLHKISILSKLKSLLLNMCIEAPEPTTNKRSSVFLETTPVTLFHKRVKRSFVLGLELIYFSRQIPCCFAGVLFLSWDFFRCSSLKLRRARISLMRFTFLDNASRWHFSFPNLNSWPAEAFNLVCPAFRRKDFFGSEFCNLGPFSLSESQLLLDYSHFSTICWVSPYNQHVDKSNNSHGCTCFQTCTYDTREDADNHTTTFHILPTIDKEF